MAKTQKQIEQEVVRLLRALRSADDARRRTLNKDLAEAMVDLREHFVTDEGRPDWTGRTGAYRLAVRELYSQAGYNKADAAPVQSAIRWHIGNIVRERLTPLEAKDAGLGGLSPLERTRRDRAARAKELEEARKLLASRRKK